MGIRWTILIGAGLIASLGGCGFARAPFDPGAWAFKQHKDEPVFLRVDGPVFVDVESFAGAVTVRADEHLRWATVQVVREARQGYGRDAAASEALDRMEYSAEVVNTETGQMLRVRTWSLDPEPWYQRANVTITTPAVDGLTVRTDGGGVTAVGVSGPVHVECAEGDARIMTDLPMLQPVLVLNRRGDVDYRVRGDSTAAFDCEALGGQIDYRVRRGRLMVHDGTAEDTLVATLNEGANPVRLQTVSGNVRIAVVADPTAVGSMIVDP